MASYCQRLDQLMDARPKTTTSDSKPVASSKPYTSGMEVGPARCTRGRGPQQAPRRAARREAAVARRPGARARRRRGGDNGAAPAADKPAAEGARRRPPPPRTGRA